MTGDRKGKAGRAIVAASDYWRITPQIAELTTFAENFTQLRTWFANRIEWLDARLLADP